MTKKWTENTIKQEALKYKTRTDFYKGSRCAYKKALKLNILDMISNHMKPVCNKPLTEEFILAEALKYKTRTEFQKNSPSAYHASYRKGNLDKICSHMDLLWSKKWTEETIKEEVLKYNKRSDFIKYSNGAYEAAIRLGIINKVINLIPIKHKKWVFEEIKEKAFKYNKRSIFQKLSPKEYDYAHNKGWLDEICKHMIISANDSIPEIGLLDTIKIYFPEAKKLRDRKVFIENKNYIKGFDIDIYIPDLKKGIEFDGKYWHGKGFKRSWTDNPDEYHKIKDGYFRNKGIEILHIKEEDWINNKKACIEKCLDFLIK